MVVSAEDHATRAGLAAMRKGGNAVDAAITVGFVLAVTHPAAGNIGGGGFMLIRFADGRSTFIDFRERAPAAATRDMFLGDDGEPTVDSVEGYRAVAVPGTVRGFDLARRKYGVRPWAELVKPALQLTRKGFPVSRGLAESLRANARLQLFEESRRIFLRHGRPYEPGERFRQPKLRATLKRIARRGPDEFYRGKTARLIAADMKRNGGLVTMADLAEYEAVERRPLAGRYRDYEILSAPPPSSGGAGVVQMLNMLEGTAYAAGGAGSASAIHYVAEVMRRFFADRAEHFGDADFADVPIEKLTGKKYAADRRSTIRPDRATPSEDVRPGRPLGYESPETTHYSIVDAEGNAVAVTYTLNGLYGSGVAARGTGVLLNNIMDDFTSKLGEPNMFGLLQSEKNAIEPRKRPLSAMTPTIVSRGGELFMVVGAPGGPTIISHRAADHYQRRRFQHGLAAGGRFPALPSPVDARRAAHGRRLFSAHDRRTEAARTHDQIREYDGPRHGNPPRRRMARGSGGFPLGRNSQGILACFSIRGWSANLSVLWGEGHLRDREGTLQRLSAHDRS